MHIKMHGGAGDVVQVLGMVSVYSILVHTIFMTFGCWGSGVFFRLIIFLSSLLRSVFGSGWSGQSQARLVSLKKISVKN